MPCMAHSTRSRQTSRSPRSVPPGARRWPGALPVQAATIETAGLALRLFVVLRFLRLSCGRFDLCRDDVAGLGINLDLGDIPRLGHRDIKGPDELTAFLLQLRTLDRATGNLT